MKQELLSELTVNLKYLMSIKSQLSITHLDEIIDILEGDIPISKIHRVRAIRRLYDKAYDYTMERLGKCEALSSDITKSQLQIAKRLRLAEERQQTDNNRKEPKHLKTRRMPVIQRYKEYIRILRKSRNQ